MKYFVCTAYLCCVINSYAQCELRRSYQEISERGQVAGVVWIHDGFRLQFIPEDYRASLDCAKSELILQHVSKPAVIRFTQIKFSPGPKEGEPAPDPKNVVTLYSPLGDLNGESADINSNGFEFRELNLKLETGGQKFHVYFKAETRHYEELLFSFNCLLNSLQLN